MDLKNSAESDEQFDPTIYETPECCIAAEEKITYVPTDLEDVLKAVLMNIELWVRTFLLFQACFVEKMIGMDDSSFVMLFM